MYGVIDIGSNTMRLNIYQYDNNEINLMMSKKITAGLVGYINEDGYMISKGIEKAIEGLNEFKTILKSVAVKEIFVFATAALRNINNSGEAKKFIESKTGFNIHIISGEEEAYLGYSGAAMKLKLRDGLLVDIGGGSTELVFYQEGRIGTVLSLPFGSLSLYNKYVKDFLPTEIEMNRIKKRVVKELAAKIPNSSIPMDTKIICGVGGTVRATYKLRNELLELPNRDREMDVSDIEKIKAYYLSERHDFITNIIKLIPDRLHTILPGMVILNTIAQYYKSKSILVSEFGVREGSLYKMIIEKGFHHD